MKQRSEERLPLVDALMREHTGLTVGHLRDEERLSVLTAAMREAGFSDDAAYALFLRTYPSSLLDLASQLSVGETYFFRDAAQLKLLTDDVLPRLLVARAKDHVLKFWSAGCASGEEAYTLAMLLDERGLLERAEIVGSDISEVALARARSGRFSAWSLRATPKLAAQRYFRTLGREFVLAPAIRERVSFQRQNLTATNAPLPGRDGTPCDVIFCRNVLIYFTDKACLDASVRLAHALAPGGTLFTGPSDPFIAQPELLRETTTAGVTFMRVNSAEPTAAPRALPCLPTTSEFEQRLWSRREPEPSGALVVRRAKPLTVPGERRARVLVEARRSAREQDEAEAALLEPPENALERVRDVGKREGSERAIDACRRALEALPEAIDLHLWLSALLLELARDAEAEVSLRTLLYLDRKLIMGHLLSALLARRRGDHERAARAYQRVVTLCAEHEDEEPVPMGEGLDHRTLAENAAAELRALSKREVRP
jgi:chemotaxis protein methyltransferase CheR